MWLLAVTLALLLTPATSSPLSATVTTPPLSPILSTSLPSSPASLSAPPLTLTLASTLPSSSPTALAFSHAWLDNAVASLCWGYAPPGSTPPPPWLCTWAVSRPPSPRLDPATCPNLRSAPLALARPLFSPNPAALPPDLLPTTPLAALCSSIAAYVHPHKLLSLPSASLAAQFPDLLAAWSVHYAALVPPPPPTWLSSLGDMYAEWDAAVDATVRTNIAWAASSLAHAVHASSVFVFELSMDTLLLAPLKPLVYGAVDCARATGRWTVSMFAAARGATVRSLFSRRRVAGAHALSGPLRWGSPSASTLNISIPVVVVMASLEPASLTAHCTVPTALGNALLNDSTLAIPVTAVNGVAMSVSTGADLPIVPTALAGYILPLAMVAIVVAWIGAISGPNMWMGAFTSRRAATLVAAVMLKLVVSLILPRPLYLAVGVAAAATLAVLYIVPDETRRKLLPPPLAALTRSAALDARSSPHVALAIGLLALQTVQALPLRSGCLWALTTLLLWALWRVLCVRLGAGLASTTPPVNLLYTLLSPSRVDSVAAGSAGLALAGALWVGPKPAALAGLAVPLVHAAVSRRASALVSLVCLVGAAVAAGWAGWVAPIVLLITLAIAMDTPSLGCTLASLVALPSVVPRRWFSWIRAGWTALDQYGPYSDESLTVALTGGSGAYVLYIGILYWCSSPMSHLPMLFELAPLVYAFVCLGSAMLTFANPGPLTPIAYYNWMQSPPPLLGLGAGLIVEWILFGTVGCISVAPVAPSLLIATAVHAASVAMFVVAALALAACVSLLGVVRLAGVPHLRLHLARRAGSDEDDVVWNVTVSRENLVQSTLAAVAAADDADLLRTSRVVFYSHGAREEGSDDGGLTVEWLALFARALLAPRPDDPRPLLVPAVRSGSSDAPVYGVNPELGPESAWMYGALGKMLVRLFAARTSLGFELSPALTRAVLAQPVATPDLAVVDPELAASKAAFKAHVDSAAELDVHLAFVYEYHNAAGALVSVPLVPDGDSKPVSSSNYDAYMAAFARGYLTAGMEQALEAFAAGAHSLAPPHLWRSAFGEDERSLARVLRGTCTLDVDEWRASSRNQVGEPLWTWLWSIIDTEFNDADRLRLLQAVTGAALPPVGGLGALDPPMTVAEAIVHGPDALPTASVCSNTLRLPDYGSRAVLHDKLVQFCDHPFGFGRA